MDREIVIKIKLGNETMQTPNDVVTVLQELADRLYDGPNFPKHITLSDDNGNKVGSFELKDREIDWED